MIVVRFKLERVELERVKLRVRVGISVGMCPSICVGAGVRVSMIWTTSMYRMRRVTDKGNRHGWGYS